MTRAKTTTFTSMFAIVLMLVAVAAHGASPFGATARVTSPTPSGYRRLQVDLAIPKAHYLYADRISVEAEGVTLHGQDIPKPKMYHDEIMEEELGIYDQDVAFVYRIDGDPDFPMAVTVSFQGCSKEPMVCFLPTTETLFVSPPGGVPGAAPANEPTDSDIAPVAPVADWVALAAPFTLAGRAAGYLDPDAFLEFLGHAESGGELDDNALGSALKDSGILVVLLAILLGGLALNLTPCVLPMIPINIAIIGAGAQAGSRARGFALGAVYGAGIAVVYGGLGLVVALTGAKFGALNASPVFNLVIAVLFVVMALAMFGLFNIDFSRFQKGGNARSGSFITAAALGAVAALLAGACVAPVVIAVLLLATDLHSRGIAAGLLLPFVLGLGMALPWPFAGAGLSFLPKPGAWMERVKIVFGVVILAFALWYGRLGVSLLLGRMDTNRAAVAEAQEESVSAGGWHTSLTEALQDSQASGKPLLIDFWATWCKNCLHMEKTTFKDPDVLAALEGYVTLKYQAENIADEETEAVLDHFGAFGLPTYVVLTPPGAETAPTPGIQ